MEATVQQEKPNHRFVVNLEGATALLLYKEEGDTIYFVHTEVPPEMEGKGIGGQLAKAGLNYAREKHLKVVARCPFVASYLKRHPEYQDLVRARLNSPRLTTFCNRRSSRQSQSARSECGSGNRVRPVL